MVSINNNKRKRERKRERRGPAFISYIGQHPFNTGISEGALHSRFTHQIQQQTEKKVKTPSKSIDIFVLVKVLEHYNEIKSK